MKPKKLYLKALSRNCAGELVSCHGGTQVWPDVGGVVTIPEAERGQACTKGALHALRIQDLPHWLGTHYLVLEMPDAKVHRNKVYGYHARVVRALTPEQFDGVDYCVAFAQYCAEQGTEYSDAAASKFLAARFPAGFLDGVVE